MSDVTNDIICVIINTNSEIVHNTNDIVSVTINVNEFNDFNNNDKNSLFERIKWATTKPNKISKVNGRTMAQIKKEAASKEKIWGNSIIGQTNNGQWTTLLGERLVYDILKLKGENPRKVERKGGFEPDWETDEYIYEVKTSNWWVSGTAGEKVLGTWIKYQDIPELYGKPLRIVCIANQEWELEFGKTIYFGDNVSPKTKQILELAKSWGITYMRFSDLVKKYKTVLNKLNL